MSTQTLNRNAVMNPYEQWMLDQSASMLSNQPKSLLDITAPEDTLPEEPNDVDIGEAIKEYATALRTMDSDHRLDYVMSTNPAITEEHIGRLALLTHRDWLDDPARDRMRAIAQDLAKENRYPGEVLLDWLTHSEFVRFRKGLEETEFPDPIIAACYALCEADKVAHASYRIQENRLRPGTPMPRIVQTPEEIAGDLRAARLR